MKKRFISLLLAVLVVFACISIPTPAEAANASEVRAKMDEYVRFLKSYGGNAYWNAGYGMSTLSTALDEGKLSVGLTPNECATKRVVSYDSNGKEKVTATQTKCTSNSFGGTQCHGFAKYFCYYLYGSYPTRAAGDSVTAGYDSQWKYYQKKEGDSFPELQSGDFIRYWDWNRDKGVGTEKGKGATHTAIVHYIKDDQIYVIDCNHSVADGGSCRISANEIDGTKYYSLKVSEVKAAYNGNHAYICRYNGSVWKPSDDNSSIGSVIDDSSYTGYVAGTNGALAINSKAASGNQVGRIPEGASCTVYPGKSSGNWLWVNYNGTTGYAYGKYIKKSSTQATANASISLSKTSWQIKDDVCVQLTVTTVPAGQSVTWTSSNTAVATVNDGWVDAKKAGSTTITASMTYGGKTYTASCVITVTSSECTNHVAGTFLYYEEKHPHWNYYACANCGEAFTNWSDRKILSCSICNPVDNSSYTGYVSGTNGALAINSKPNSDSKIGRIPEGESCKVYPSKSSGNWLWVEYNGVSGYVYKTYITTTKPAPAQCTKHVEGTFLYYGEKHPHWNYYACANCGETFTNWSNRTVSSCDICNPVDNSSYTGYVSGTNGALAINSGPNSDSKIGRIPEGESCTVYPGKSSGNWLWVEYNGVSGYAYKTYITTIKPAPVVNTRTGVVTGTNGALAINSEANSKNQIGRIPEGSSCTVYPDKSSGNWYWVSYNGIEGYAYKTYIKLS